MNTPEKPRPSKSSMSAEAVVGIGITVLSLGVLCLLLGWAQWMRHVHDVATIFLGIGGALFVLGAIAALVGRKK